MNLPCVSDVIDALERIAPLRLAADWDNVGLLVGDRLAECPRIMTCLTITGSVVDEAIEKRVGLIIAHHPLPFHPLKKISTDTVTGSYLWRLIRNGTSIYSAHTAYDSAEQGINQQIADRLGLQNVGPLVPNLEAPTVGEGRIGELPKPMQVRSFGELAKTATGSNAVRLVGNPDGVVRRVAIGCGSGGSFLSTAIGSGCDALVTGESNFHGCLEAEASGVSMVLVGHYWSERFAMEWLAGKLRDDFTECEVWASENETNPLVEL